MPIKKETLDTYLKDLAKEFRKLNGTKTPAEIVLIGGAAVLAGYGFRDATYDIDALIEAARRKRENASSAAIKKTQRVPISP